MIIDHRSPYNYHLHHLRCHHLWHDMEPAKLVVVPGASLGELKVHLLGENREAKLVGVQLQL